LKLEIGNFSRSHLPDPDKPEPRNGSRVNAFVRNPKISFPVIPAFAGILSFQIFADHLDSCFTKVTSFYETVRIQD
jgi:hypothetical protein